MYRILIIDDEEPLREAIRILGDWERLGVTEIIEARNGKEGYASVVERKPDLILVDMKMPEMSGPAFLQQMEQEYPDITTIVISGYNDFEYTKQAIKSGAVDYLLKPVNKSELNLTLERAFNAIKEKRRKESEYIDRNITLNLSLPKLKEKIFLSILERSFNPQTSKGYLRMIDAEGDDKYFGIALLCIMNMEQIRERRFKQDTELFYFALTNVINESGHGDADCFSFNHPKRDREIVLIFTFEAARLDTMGFMSETMVSRAVNKLHSLFGVIATGAVGPLCPAIEALPEAFAAADRILHSINLIPLQGPLVAKAVVKGEPENHSLAARMSFIRHALEEGNPNAAASIVNEYTARMKKTGYFGLGDASRFLREFIILLEETALESGVANEELALDCETALRTRGIPFDYATFAQFERLLQHILDYFGEKIRSSIKNHQQFNIHDIKEYIHNHYFEDIKISLFTEKYFLSREYLMKLFKQEFGSGIYEYVQKVRMEKAKTLLLDPKLKIQDISEMLGFKDKNYFSKAFKNYHQLSPSEYRGQMLDPLP